MTTSDYDGEDGQTPSSGGSHSAPRPIPPILSSDDDPTPRTGDSGSPDDASEPESSSAAPSAEASSGEPSQDTAGAQGTGDAEHAPEAVTAAGPAAAQPVPAERSPRFFGAPPSQPTQQAQPAPEADGQSAGDAAPSAPQAPSRLSAFGAARSASQPQESGSTLGSSSDPAATQAWAGAPLPAPQDETSGQAQPGESSPTAEDPMTVGPTKPTTAGLGARTASMPTVGGAAGAGAAATAPAEPQPERAALEEDSWLEGPRSRVAAHIWGTVVTLILVPITWLLLTDGVLRTYYSLADGASSPNMAGVLSLAGGLIGLLVLALIARASSIGGWVWGGVLAAWGVVPLVVPVQFADWISAVHGPLTSLHQDFGQNVHDYILVSGRSGLLLVLGVVIMLFALVSHTARRSGREEGRLKEALAQRDRMR